jgi:D-alanyl-D-alanine carboxypeptidase
VIRTSSNDRQFSTQINVNETRTQVSTIPRKSPIRLHQLKYNVVSQSHKKLPSNTVLGPLFQAKSKLTKQSKLPQINDSKDEVTNETIRAKSFLVFDNLEEKCLESMNPLMRLEMASLTKIMTFYTIIKFF